MTKKTIFALTLVFLGVSTGSLVILTYSLTGGKFIITLPFLVIAIVCIITGTIVGFTRILDNYVNPVLDEVQQDLEDEIQDLKQGSVKTTVWMGILVLISTLTFAFFVLRLHKFEAMWWKIPVTIPAMIGVILLAWFINRTYWYQNPNTYTPIWVFLIPTIGFILAMWIGLTRTENLRGIRASRLGAIEYNVVRATDFVIWDTLSFVEGADADILDCEGEACGVLLVIALIVLTFVLVIGSAFIPHFWMLSGSILLSIMLLITIRDLRIRQPKESKK